MLNPEFLLASIIVVLVPGTGAVYTISTGLSQNWKASIAAAVGCTLGIIPHIIACILGLSAILNMSAQVFSVIKFAGAGYLLYLAWKMWKDAGKLNISSNSMETTPSKIILKAIGLNLLNPKLTIFFLSFLPLFISKNSISPMVEMVSLSFMFMFITLVIFLAYGLLASAISSSIKKSASLMKRTQRFFAIVLAGFAIKLVFTDK
jgi:threonine/homoserine/homoserine lactone efflux protein